MGCSSSRKCEMCKVQLATLTVEYNIVYTSPWAHKVNDATAYLRYYYCSETCMNEDDTRIGGKHLGKYNKYRTITSN